MKKNIGKIDRIIRLVVGVVLVANAFVGWQSPWGWIGVILIATAFMNFCPVYPLLKLDTRSSGEKIGLK